MRIVHGDITALDFPVDVIVNSCHPTLMAGSGVCGAIHKVAGPELQEECEKTKQRLHMKVVEESEPIITKAYGLNAKQVYHVRAPKYQDDNVQKTILRWCYENCVNYAKKYGVKSIAFPLLGSGVFGWPYDTALEIAKESLTDTDMDIILVLYGG